MPIKTIIDSAGKAVVSAVDTANKATVDFLKSTNIPAFGGAPKPKTLAETRKKQGEGFYQADIGD